MHSVGSVLHRGKVSVERSFRVVAQSTCHVAVHVRECLDEAFRMTARQPSVRARPLGQLVGAGEEDVLGTVRRYESQPVRILL